MVAPIEKGLITYVQNQLSINVWDGEIPRQDGTGADIDPEALPTDWPAVTVELPENGLQRKWSFEGPYSDEGTISILVFGAAGNVTEGRAQTRKAVCNIEVLLAREDNWINILTGVADELGNAVYYVIDLLLDRWTVVQQPGPSGALRTKTGEIIYRGEMWYEVKIHGEVQVRQPGHVLQ